MERKAASGIMLTLLLTTILALQAFNIQPVEVSGTVYIRADGSIDPLTTPISSVDNATYTFTGNINDSIVVQKNNTVIDGAGFSLRGEESGVGLMVVNIDKVTVKNTNIRNFTKGICVLSSSYVIIACAHGEPVP